MKYLILFLLLIPNTYAFLEITEVMYKPLESYHYNEWIEIYNNENISINITKLKLCSNIILPGFINHSNNELYFYNNECNEIDTASINGIDIKEIIQECNGPFNDFGVLNNNKIYIKYIMKELNIDTLEELNIKYTNFHLNEEKMELEDNIIKLINEDEYIHKYMYK